VRVGVGRPDSTDPDIVAAYVLGKWRQPPLHVDPVRARAADGRAHGVFLDNPGRVEIDLGKADPERVVFGEATGGDSSTTCSRADAARRARALHAS
jgi:hypothetical protein